VLAGAITTCGSGVFMFACQFIFFNKVIVHSIVQLNDSLIPNLFASATQTHRWPFSFATPLLSPCSILSLSLYHFSI
jgi:hypothetical protein